MSPMFAFLHHVAAFTLVSTLALEFVLMRGTLTAENARRIRLADLIFGVSAGVILVIGFLRVFYFEKGAAYYFHSYPFLGKISLFAIIGVLSIYPTIQFLSWGKVLKQGQVPVLEDKQRRLIRSIIHLELVGIVFLIFCAALMAKGV